MLRSGLPCFTKFLSRSDEALCSSVESVDYLGAANSGAAKVWIQQTTRRSTRVAAIEHHRDVELFLDHVFQQKVQLCVAQVTTFGIAEIHRNDYFIKAGLSFDVLELVRRERTAAVSRIVNQDLIARLCNIGEALHGVHDIFIRGPLRSWLRRVNAFHWS